MLNWGRQTLAQSTIKKDMLGLSVRASSFTRWEMKGKAFQAEEQYMHRLEMLKGLECSGGGGQLCIGGVMGDTQEDLGMGTEML